MMIRRALFNTLLIAALYIAALGALLWYAHTSIKKESQKQAEYILENTALRTDNLLTEVETVTRNFEWLVTNNMHPDSLLEYSNRIVELNPNLNGCSITTEPNFFPKLGRDFSAYTVRHNDTIETVMEGEYDYYSKDWYKNPREAGKSVWVDPYDDFNEAGTLYSTDMIASYSLPLYNADSTFIGVISTDLSLPKLSESITDELPYEGSYYMMTGKSGNFLMYPDKDRLIYHTIFDGVNPRMHPDIISLGHNMTEGKKGSMSVNFEGVNCLVSYQPLSKAGWSIALVCPEKSIMGNFSSFVYITIALLLAGILMLLYYHRRHITNHQAES